MPKPPKSQEGTKAPTELAHPSSGRHQDFSYRQISDAVLADADFQQSLFNGAVFSRCDFQSVNFARCDFAGTKLISCTFSKCNFVSVEMRSCFLTKCNFTRCDFGGASWDRTQTQDCEFNECRFQEVSLREATFSNSSFDDCGFDKSSVTLNRYGKCRFNRTNLSDCTALFLFLDDCTFAECQMNAETVGFTYGLTNENLDTLSFVHLGKSQDRPIAGDLVDVLIETYRERRWYVGVAALELNFRRRSALGATRNFCIAIGSSGELSGSMDWDELQFFARLLHRLGDEQRLPLLGLKMFLELVHAEREAMYKEFPIAEGFSPAADLVVGQVEALMDRSLDAILSFFPAFVGKDPTLVLRWSLTERPENTIENLLPKDALRPIAIPKISLVEAHAGSWIETWKLSLTTLMAIQICLGSITGVTRQLIKLGQEIAQLCRPLVKISPLPKLPKAAKKKGGLQLLRVTR